MTLANDLYTYRRLPKTILETAPHRKTDSGHFDLPQRPPSLPDIDRHQIEQNVLQQADADRVLYFTTHHTYKVDADPAAVDINNRGLNYLNYDLARAFRCFRDATKTDPGFALAWNNLGLVYLEIGDLDQANHCWIQAINIDETLDIAYGNAGLTALENGNYAKAWQHLNQAISLDPNEPIYYNSMGILCLELNYPHDAIHWFNLAIELNPNLPMPYHNRGRAYLLLNDYQKADHDIKKAYQLDVDQPPTTKANP